MGPRCEIHTEAITQVGTPKSPGTYLCYARPLKAKCDTFKDAATLCAKYGANGLVDAECSGVRCTKATDAPPCCNPAANAVKCSTISAIATTFCSGADYGNGVIDDAAETFCAKAE